MVISALRGVTWNSLNLGDRRENLKGNGNTDSKPVRVSAEPETVERSNINSYVWMRLTNMAPISLSMNFVDTRFLEYFTLNRWNINYNVYERIYFLYGVCSLFQYSFGQKCSARSAQNSKKRWESPRNLWKIYFCLPLFITDTTYPNEICFIDSIRDDLS